MTRPTDCLEYFHFPMSTRKQNVILHSLLKREEDSGLSSSAHFPSSVMEKSHRKSDDWCIVATDGSTRIIRCKSAANQPEVNEPDQALAQDGACSLDLDEDVQDELPYGVDLSYLNVEKETASKLIAGLHAMTVDEPASLSRREIEMPSAKTDLQEIFKTDKVCIVRSPKTVTEGFRV
jgi:hypothetical protein